MKLFSLATAATFSFLASSLVASSAHAEEMNVFGDAPTESSTPQDATKLRPGIGARVGGYGFRDSGGQWTDCRMNGIGIFGTMDIGRHFFGELGIDSYSLVHPSGNTMDRTSLLTSVAAGFRMFPDFVITPYVQVGGGLEYTRVDVDGGRTTGAYPMAFLALGGELNVTHEFKLGTVMRMLAMARPNTDGDDSIVYQHPTAPKMEYQPVAQMMFYFRYAI